MYKSVLKTVNAEQRSASHISTKQMPDDYKSLGCEDEKSTSPTEETVIDYVNRVHDFTKISEEDLSTLFGILRKRCPLSWTEALETRAKSFHRKIMTIRNEKNISKYIDPQEKIGNSVKFEIVNDAKNLIVSPGL